MYIIEDNHEVEERLPEIEGEIAAASNSTEKRPAETYALYEDYYLRRRIPQCARK